MQSEFPGIEIMNTFSKAISGILAVGALGFAMNAQAVEKCGPEAAAAVNAAPVVKPCAASPQVQAPQYPAYGYQRQWYNPSYYGYRGPWSNNRSWTPWRNNRNYNYNNWDNRNYWGNRSWSDYDLGPLSSAVDTFGHMDIEMDFELEFDWDIDADADIDADLERYGEGYGRNDSRFDNRFYNRYGNRYYNGYYGRYAPYNYYYNYQYGYNYPAAPQAAPTPAPQQPVKPPVSVEQKQVDVKPAAPAKPISVDDDKDSILNSSDFCPNTAEGTQVDSFGCAIDETIVLRGVNFHTDSDKLTDESIVILDGVSTTLNAHPELRLEVSGHTDSDAEDDYNRHLSQRRAERVREYLVNKGAVAENLTAKGYGEERPVASNESAEGKALNRRVELNRL